jgi:hypothetical protein
MFEFFSTTYNSFVEFMNSGVYEFITEFLAVFVKYYFLAIIEAKIFFIGIAWGVAQNLFANLGLSDSINQAWGNLDSTLLSYLTFFRLPEALNIIIQASITRFVLNLF